MSQSYEVLTRFKKQVYAVSESTFDAPLHPTHSASVLLRTGLAGVLKLT